MYQNVILTLMKIWFLIFKTAFLFKKYSCCILLEQEIKTINTTKWKAWI